MFNVQQVISTNSLFFPLNGGKNGESGIKTLFKQKKNSLGNEMHKKIKIP